MTLAGWGVASVILVVWCCGLRKILKITAAPTRSGWVSVSEIPFIVLHSPTHVMYPQNCIEGVFLFFPPFLKYSANQIPNL